jgi:hypothetical protein
MLRLAIVAVCLLLAACGDDDGDAAPSQTALAAELTVTVRPEGPGGPVRERRVECQGFGSEAEDPVCRGLTAESLAPVPRTTPCTAIYGGPDVARVTGTIDGERVDERFSREDGCQIARWDENVALLGRPSNRPG